MPKCKPCMGARIKEAILSEFPGLEEILAEIPECKKDATIELCHRSSGGSEGPRQKRAPSAYNIHTGKCMKSGKSMKTCAQEWKSRGNTGD